MSSRTKSKTKSLTKRVKASKSTELLTKELVKKEAESKAKRDAEAEEEKKRKETAAKELHEKRKTEWQAKYWAEERAKIGQKLQELKVTYDAKYPQKLDYGAQSVESQKPIKVVNTEDSLLMKYNYNIVPDVLVPPAHDYSKLVRVEKRNGPESFACRIIEFSKAPHVKTSLEAESYRVLSFLTTLKHANLVSPAELFLVGEKLYIFHELLSDSLEVYVKVGGGMNEIRTRLFSRDIGEALAFLHTHGIAHRNIRVGSVLIDRANNSAKLTNFELACVFWKPGVNRIQHFPPIYPKGTTFIPPEARGESSAPYNVKKADVWSWADTVVFMLTKQNVTDDFDKFRQDNLKSASQDCVELLQKCLDSPENRPDFPDILSFFWYQAFVDTNS